MAPKNLKPVPEPEPAPDELSGLVARLAEIVAPSPPRPHYVHASWYPAGIKLPTGRILNRAKIFATDLGLYVFTAATDAPTWYSPIVFRETCTPKAGIMAANGIPIVTDDGPALITPMGGCGCGSVLKRWVPEWARVEAPWPAQA